MCNHQKHQQKTNHFYHHHHLYYSSYNHNINHHRNTHKRHTTTTLSQQQRCHNPLTLILVIILTTAIASVSGHVNAEPPQQTPKSPGGGGGTNLSSQQTSSSSVISNHGTGAPSSSSNHHLQHHHPQQPQQEKQSRCQEITIPMCKTIRYNHTEMPNPFNHETQEEAGLEVHQYWPLVEGVKCSDDLKFFICSLYVPICMEDYAGSVPPCRSVCERARAGCEPVMTQYGFFWPERMACEQFPRYGRNSVCMDEKGGEMPNTNTPAIIPKSHNPPPPSPPIKAGGVIVNAPTATRGSLSSPPASKCRVPGECTCNSPLVLIRSSSYLPIHGFGISGGGSNTTVIVTGTTPHCAFPCRGYGYSSQDEIRFANYWLTFWSSVTCAMATLTILTFLIDSSRFKYPERPIICISFCYVFVSFGYLIRIYAGHSEIACGGPDSPVVRYPGLLITPHQTNSPVCTIVFLLIYYFTIAGSSWYVVLTTTWYLASVLKWGTEAISEKSGVFHAIVWVSSAVLTLVVLLTDSIDGDSISGICFVGNQDYWNLVLFVLAPMGGLLGLGSIFLVSGFVALLRIRSVIAREVRNFHKLEKLMIRIGVFGIIYTVNVLAILFCNVYEAWVRDEWVKGVNCNNGNGRFHNCVENNGLGVGVTVTNNINAEFYKPAYWMLMTKYFMSLATGITSSIWVFSSKTVETWRRFVYARVLFLCFPGACRSNTGSSSSSSQHTTSILTAGGGNHHHLHQHHHHTLHSKQTHV